MAPRIVLALSVCLCVAGCATRRQGGFALLDKRGKEFTEFGGAEWSDGARPHYDTVVQFGYVGTIALSQKWCEFIIQEDWSPEQIADEMVARWNEQADKNCVASKVATDDGFLVKLTNNAGACPTAEQIKIGFARKAPAGTTPVSVDPFPAGTSRRHWGAFSVRVLHKRYAGQAATP